MTQIVLVGDHASNREHVTVIALTPVNVLSRAPIENNLVDTGDREADGQWQEPHAVGCGAQVRYSASIWN